MGATLAFFCDESHGDEDGRNHGGPEPHLKELLKHVGARASGLTKCLGVEEKTVDNQDAGQDNVAPEAVEGGR